MKYLIIGLGNYGYVLAEELSEFGHEVIAIDNDASRVESIKDKVASAITMDCTDEQSLRMLPLNEVDLVLVCIAESFAASIKVVAFLKKYQVKHIYARAFDNIHYSVLEALNVEKILTPESDSAHAFVSQITYNAAIDTFKLDNHYSIFRFEVPKRLAGYKINELMLNEKFNIKLIALQRGSTIKNALGISCTEYNVQNKMSDDVQLQEGDRIVCYGKNDNFQDFWKAV